MVCNFFTFLVVACRICTRQRAKCVRNTNHSVTVAAAVRDYCFEQSDLFVDATNATIGPSFQPVLAAYFFQDSWANVCASNKTNHFQFGILPLGIQAKKKNVPRILEASLMGRSKSAATLEISVRPFAFWLYMDSKVG